MSIGGQQFGRLVLAAADDLYSVDRNALLEAADAFLNAAKADNTTGLELGRRMAFRSLEWCVFDTLETYVELLKAVAAFRAYMDAQIGR